MMSDNLNIGLPYESLVSAIGHLYRATELLNGVNKTIYSGNIIFINTTDDLTLGWNEVNSCRIYTEKFLCFEELLIPSLGLINDAKCMIESLVAWNLGLTNSGKRNILNCINVACFDGIFPCIEELESWLNVSDRKG